MPRNTLPPGLSRPVFTLLLAALALSTPRIDAAEPTQPNEFLAFIKAQAASLRRDDQPPATLAEWQERKRSIRQQLEKAWGGFPAEPCPLNPRIVGTIERDGYNVEKLVFQTRPGVWMTANAYVPKGPGKHPAILQVHGHWRGAKQDPVVQSRCIGAVKLGYFVLCVDAFGAGERGVGKALGEYHGEMTGATLLPLGLPLSGLQVYENQRAVDYLKTRPEVDGDKIGITGASGGGNQSMYAGAWDDRLVAVVPVCSVGNYGAYLGTGCCLCELVPGALRFTEEWGVLGLTAPRALMVANASQDAPQFSVVEARKSLEAARQVFRLFDRPGHLKHAVFESKHDYNKSMREEMYGWMTLHLKGEGDGSPVPEPPITTEDPETLRCFPGESRPDDWITLPRFAAAEARRLLADRPTPALADAWLTTRQRLKRSLTDTVFNDPKGPFDPSSDELERQGKTRRFRFVPERGLTLSARQEAGSEADAPLAVLINLDGANKAASRTLAEEVRGAGWSLVTLDLRATGALAWPSDAVGQAPDHNSAEWSIWIGRPLLGQWAFDVRRLLDVIEHRDGKLPGRVVVIGEGPAGLVALAAGALDRRINAVAAVNSLASFVSDQPYRGQRLGVFAPGILREVGDVAHLAALNAPKRVVIAGGVSGRGEALPIDQLRRTYEPAAQVSALMNAGEQFKLIAPARPAEVVESLK
jgi:cephalosporin-C deacetylase-like acetyl esterase